MGDREFQIWLQERNSLTARLQVFLLASSILFLGYLQIKDLNFGVIIAGLGLGSCILASLHFIGVRKTLDKFEQKLDDKLKALLGLPHKRLRGRIMCLIIPIFFALVWIISMLYSFGYVNWLKW